MKRVPRRSNKTRTRDSKRNNPDETYITKRPKNVDKTYTHTHTCITRMLGMHDGERSTREIRGKAYRGNEFLLALGPPRQDRATDRPVQGKHAQKEKEKKKRKRKKITCPDPEFSLDPPPAIVELRIHGKLSNNSAMRFERSV